ncbi:hypothetical protein ABW20_dc0100111 [Dactylellina cionopaga]|nr:hypothetical protein ABW20_dc0100111 [Dactylellina cionopaga]
MTQPQLAAPLHPDLPPQQPQQQQIPSSTAPSPIPTPPEAPTLQKPPPPSTSLPSDTPLANAYNPSILKGIAASALEQPTAAESQTKAMQKPSPQAPPSLRLSTNVPTITPTDNRIFATPSSSNTNSALYTSQSRMGTQLSSKIVGESAAASATGSPAPAQPPRTNVGIGGKRPSMRHITTAQPEMTEAEKVARSEKIRDIINEQFGLEILLKHRELQDIEAELGKAEACLEQIRRCSIEDAMEKDGRFDDPSGVSVMYTPSPHVLDGPYSREYRDWLLEERVSQGRSRYHDVLARDQSRNFVIQRRSERQEPQPGSKRPQREAAPQSQKRPTICLHRQLDGSIVK